MSSAICFNLDQSKILLSGKGLKDSSQYNHNHNIAGIQNTVHFQQQKSNILFFSQKFISSVKHADDFMVI